MIRTTKVGRERRQKACREEMMDCNNILTQTSNQLDTWCADSKDDKQESMRVWIVVISLGLGLMSIITVGKLLLYGQV